MIQHCGPLRGRMALWANRLHRSGPATSDMVLDGLIVRPELRGRGYGQALVAAAAELAQERGYAGLRVELSATNEAARALYKMLGFAPVGRARIGWPWSGPAEIMRFARPAAGSSRSSPSPAPAR
ncbi:GNAT family N-acetyltransferase [Paracoccus cavernae]|uniref:GNAT family N-acetyltransferase n=1 Tax=Paracoccus cavernae TaxID=1571207 RepID=UPI003626E704